MGMRTDIAWTHATFNGWWGCEKVSAECRSCYADTFAKRVGHGVRLPVIWGGASTGRRVLGDDTWKLPEKLNAQAIRENQRFRVFASSMADTFEVREDLEPLRARLFRLIERTPMLDWLLLTKRPEHVVELAEKAGWDRIGLNWPGNVWLGTTIGLNETAHRARSLLSVRGPRRFFVSHEPALEAVSFTPFLRENLDWVIVGGESGARFRVMPMVCVEHVVSACAAEGKAAFIKQDSGLKPGQQGRIPKELWEVKDFPKTAGGARG